RDVARKGDVPAALERSGQQRRRREAMEHDGAVETGERFNRVVFRGARVDHDGLAEIGGELELPFEERALPIGRRIVAEVVEARLADGDRALVPEQLGELVDSVR